jgi:hypothetical protein
MQKITVRTLLRAFALAPAVALGWGWGRGRAKAAPATPVDPLTVDANGVTVKGKLDVNGDVGINGKVTVNGEFNGAVRVMDGGKQTYNGGIATEVNAQLINFGMNEDSGNRFGGSYTSSVQGGMFRVDTRSGQPLFSWHGREANSTNNSQVMAITSKGDVNAKGTLNAAKVTVPGTKIEGTGGRNFFLDEESKKEGVDLGGGLRVGSVWWVNGIYSAKGPAVVGSENKIIWLAGGVGIGGTTAPTAIPEGGIRAKSISFGEEDLRIIRGIIMGRANNLIWGKGFSLKAKDKEGWYRIEFNPKFTADPTIIVSPTRGNTWASCHEMEVDHCIVKTGPGGQGVDTDFGFTFIVIGPA